MFSKPAAVSPANKNGILLGRAYDRYAGFNHTPPLEDQVKGWLGQLSEKKVLSRFELFKDAHSRRMELLLQYRDGADVKVSLNEDAVTLFLITRDSSHLDIDVDEYVKYDIMDALIQMKKGQQCPDIH